MYTNTEAQPMISLGTYRALGSLPLGLLLSLYSPTHDRAESSPSSSPGCTQCHS